MFGMFLVVSPQFTAFGKNRANSGGTSGTFKKFPSFSVFLRCSCSAPRICLIFSKCSKLWGHHQEHPKHPNSAHLRYTGSVRFEFPGPEHSDRTAQDTERNTLNEPLGNTSVTFFGKIQGLPVYYLIGTLQSHDPVNCHHTLYFLSVCCSGTPQILSLGKFKMFSHIT